MNRRRTPAEDPRPVRRWHIPPPLLHGPEALEGGAVLAEVPGPLGLLLWQLFRDVALWAETRLDLRSALFAPGAVKERDRLLGAATPEPELAGALLDLRALLVDPAGIEPLPVATACGAVARWAEVRGFSATALAYAQDAALAEPGDAGTALEVARLAVRAQDHARAELWYRRATGIARRARRWRLYTRSFSGLANLYRDRGNLPAAYRFHLRALRGATRGGLRPERATAFHDLFAISVEAGRRREADRFAREALSAYPRNSPRLAALAHDIAYFWMEQGRFAQALPVFEAVLPLVADGTQRLWVEADLARAAAGAGRPEQARAAARRVRERSERPEFSAVAARALVEVARAELQMGAFDDAESTLAAALRSAGEHREGRVLLTAEALAGAITSARAAERHGEPDRSESPGADSFAQELVRSLQDLDPAAISIDRRTADATQSEVNTSIRPEIPSAP